MIEKIYKKQQFNPEPKTCGFLSFPVIVHYFKAPFLSRILSFPVIPCNNKTQAHRSRIGTFGRHATDAFMAAAELFSNSMEGADNKQLDKHGISPLLIELSELFPSVRIAVEEQAAYNKAHKGNNYLQTGQAMMFMQLQGLKDVSSLMSDKALSTGMVTAGCTTWMRTFFILLGFMQGALSFQQLLELPHGRAHSMHQHLCRNPDSGLGLGPRFPPQSPNKPSTCPVPQVSVQDMHYIRLHGTF